VYVVMNVHVVVAVMMVVVMATLVVAPMMMMTSHRPLLGRRVRDGLHGHLGDRRAPHERRDGERRDGNAWKLHVFSL
jgi:hypothetical protein